MRSAQSLARICSAVGILLSVSTAWATNVFAVYPPEPCPNEDFVVIATWCPCPAGGLRSGGNEPVFTLDVTAVAGDPEPCAVIVRQQEMIEEDKVVGHEYVLRAGPNPGLLHVIASHGIHEYDYTAIIPVGNWRPANTDEASCTSCRGDDGNVSGTETASVEDGLFLNLNLGTRMDFSASEVGVFQKRDIHLILAAKSLSTDPPTVNLNNLVFMGLPAGTHFPSADKLLDYRNAGCDEYDFIVPLGNMLPNSDDDYERAAIVDLISAGYISVTIYSPLYLEEVPNSSCKTVSDQSLVQTRWYLYQVGSTVYVSRCDAASSVVLMHEFVCGTNGDWTLESQQGSTPLRWQSSTWAYENSIWKRTFARGSGGLEDAVPEYTYVTEHGDNPTNPWTKRTMDPEGPAPIIETRSFYADGELPSLCGRHTVKQWTRPDRGTEWYQYTDTGSDLSFTRTIRRYSDWQDEHIPEGTDELTTWAHYAESVYGPTWNDSNWIAMGLRSTTRVVGGFTVSMSTTERDESAPSGTLRQINRNYVSTSDCLTTTITYDNTAQYLVDHQCPVEFITFPLKPMSQLAGETLQLPTGVTETHSVLGDFNQTTFRFDDTTSPGSLHFNDPYLIDPVHVYVEVSLSAPDESRLEVYDLQGRLAFRGTLRPSNADLSTGIDEENIRDWTVYRYDGFGRITNVFHSNGTKESRLWSDESCCQEEGRTDVNGVVTRVVRDVFGRTKYTVRLTPSSSTARRQITSYDYSAVQFDNRLLPAVTVTEGYDNSADEAAIEGFTAKLASRTVRDLAGRVVAEVQFDPANPSTALQTTYAYSYTSAGGWIVTKTRPDTKTEIRTYYADGQLKSVTGTGVIPQYYTYEAAADEAAAGELRTTVRTGSESDVRYSTTVTDMLGRVIREERPVWLSTEVSSGTLTTTHTYDSSGDLVSTETKHDDTAVAAPHLYKIVRNSNSELHRSGIETNQPNGELEPVSEDRYTETETTYEAGESGLYWHVTTTTTYKDAGTPVLLSVRKLLVNGFGSVAAPDCSDPAPAGTLVAYSVVSDEREDVVTTWTYVDVSESGSTRTEYEKHSAWAGYTVRQYQDGRLVMERSRTGVTSTYGYDGLGRQTGVSDGRTSKATEFEGLGRVWKVKDALNNTTEYLYYDQNSLGAGQVKQVIDPLGKDTYYAYDALGRIEYTWGDTPQPTRVEYTPYGERWKLHTYRTPLTGWDTDWPSAGDGDVTTWTYDDATGRLKKKEYADNTAVDYEYTASGQIAKRLWARTVGSERVTTTYGYDPQTSELRTITYNDGTPDITMTYDRRGRLDMVTQAGASSLNYDYDYSNWPTSVSVATSGLYAKTLSQTFEPSMGGQLTQQTLTGGYYANYFYNASSGRLARVTGPGLPVGGSASGAHYSYEDGSDLVSGIEFKDANEQVLLTTTRTFEANRDITATIKHTWNQSTPATDLAVYDWDPDDLNVAADALGRRGDLELSGTAYATTLTRDFGHNDRNELTSAVQTGGTGVSWGYSYDPIGNRATSTKNAGTSVTTTYLRNELNQYYRADAVGGAALRQGLRYDADGNLVEQFVAADMDCNGVIGFPDINAFTLALSNPAQYALQYPNCDILNGDINGDGATTMADLNPFIALMQGGLGAGGLRAEYVWDAENRLTVVRPTPGTEQDGNLRVEFGYDYQGRRVRKTVTVWDQTLNGGAGGWSSGPLKGAYVRKFVLQDWLMLAELDENDDPIRQYTWGLDLAGLNGAVNDRESAGGIGGLLAVHLVTDAVPNRGTVDYVFCHDDLGNVGQIVDLAESDINDALVARYEYDPYGNVVGPDANGDGTLDFAGWYAGQNPMRFSTKYFDEETGLAYFGARYYHAGLGRWLNRDPLGEAGGTNMYAYAGNDPANHFDPLGRRACPQSQPTTQPEVPDVPRCPAGNPICKMHCKPRNRGLGGASGAATCDPVTGTNCICVCDDNIERDNSTGGKKAVDLITQCVAREESSESRNIKCEKGKLPGDSGKNISACVHDTENLKCLKKALSECDTLLCKGAILAYAESQKRQCETYGTDQASYDGYIMTPPCPGADKDACIKAYEDVLNEARGGDKKPPVPSSSDH